MSNFYNQASWVLVPSGIEEDIVFAQKPISGLGDLTFTRASDATYTDSTGVVRRSPYNLVTWSEMFSDVAWSKGNSTISINTTNAPTGTLTADTFAGDGTNAVHSVFQSATLLASRSYNISLFVKKGTNNFIQIGGGGVLFGAEVYANFDLNNGTIGSKGTLTTAQIENYGNGWYRCSVTGTTISAATNTGLFAQLVTSNTSARGESNTLSTNVFIWGAQLVEGSSALDYFPTTDRLNVPRIDFRNADGTLSSCGRLLLEPQRTNSIRNSSMVGAVAGSPGTLPTNWQVINGAGLTQSVVGLGTESGTPYIDFRFNGTATGTNIEVRFDSTTSIAAANGQAWTLNTYAKIISGTFNTASLGIYERTSAGIIVVQGFQVVVPTSTLQRFAYTRTLSGGATVAAVQPAIIFSVTNGAAYDFTIRIAAPQMELGAYATTWVPTTTAAVTRLADTASKTGVSSLIGQTEGTLFVDVNLDSRVTQSYFAISLSANSITNYIGFGFKATTIVFEVVTGGVLQAIGTFTNSSIGSFKLAIGYKLNDFVFYLNGTQIGTDNSGTVPACNDIVVYNSTYGQSQAMKYNQAVLFPTRLTNAELAQLTTL